MLIGNIIMATILAVVLICQVYAFRTGVPTFATFPGRRKAMIAILQQKFAARGDDRTLTIVDLGSGGGQLCRAIARALPQSKVAGVELSPLPHLRASIIRRLFGPANVRFFRRDFWRYDIGDADAIVLFLTRNVMQRMGEKLHREAKPGCLIIASDDPLLDGWEPVEIVSDPILGLASRIYVYRQA